MKVLIVLCCPEMNPPVCFLQCNFRVTLRLSQQLLKPLWRSVVTVSGDVRRNGLHRYISADEFLA